MVLLSTYSQIQRTFLHRSPRTACLSFGDRATLNSNQHFFSYAMLIVDVKKEEVSEPADHLFAPKERMQ